MPSPVSPSLTKMIDLRPSLMLPRWTAADLSAEIVTSDRTRAMSRRSSMLSSAALRVGM